MKLILAKKASEEGMLPMSLNTLYKWHCQKKYPALVIKVANKLFFDLDEWEKMAEQAINNQVKESERIRSFLK